MATIDNGLTFEEFRKRCEDKSTITTKGQLYVGTSVHDTVNGKQITRTVATPEPVEYALLVRDDTQAGGLNWKSVAEVLSAASNDGHQSTSVESAHNAKTAGVASNVESQINGHDISVIFETDGTTVKEATEAANVSQTINGQNISSIFESNGTTVKNATNAINATKTSFSGDWTYVTTGEKNLPYGFVEDFSLYEVIFFDDSIGTASYEKPYVHGFFYLDVEKLKSVGAYCCPIGVTLVKGSGSAWNALVSYVVRLTNNNDLSFTIQVESRGYTLSSSFITNFQFRSVT